MNLSLVDLSASPQVTNEPFELGFLHLFLRRLLTLPLARLVPVVRLLHLGHVLLADDRVVHDGPRVVHLLGGAGRLPGLVDVLLGQLGQRGDPLPDVVAVLVVLLLKRHGAVAPEILRVETVNLVEVCEKSSFTFFGFWFIKNKTFILRS